MRKLCFMFTALLLTAPVFAGVTITCEQVPDTNQVLVKYVSDANLPRAFGLDITVDNGMTIDTIVSGSPSEYFWVYPGTIDINSTTGDVDHPGTPVAPSADPCALGGLGTSGITIEMGSLYDPCDDEHPTGPSTTEDLFKFTVSGSSDCNVTIEGNSARGDVVLENTDPASTNLPATCHVSLDCFSGTTEEYNNWVAWGKPDNWCGSCWRCGDVTNDGYVTFGDVTTVLNDFKAMDTTGRSDANMDGYLTFGDVTYVLNKFKAGLGCTPCL